MEEINNLESILNSIKQLLGISEGDTNFDTDIIIHINSVLSNLRQMGVGPKEKFSIVDEKSVWSDFTGEDTDYDEVKTYVYLRVKKIFDPPANSNIMNAMNEEIQELGWRLNVSASNEAMEEEEDYE